MTIKRKLLLALAVPLVTAGLVVPTLRPAYAASLTEVTSFGDNPGRMRMHVYVPADHRADHTVRPLQHDGPRTGVRRGPALRHAAA
ncbi:hypothetical protein ACWCO3_33745, partial [Micromonospora sp. NPDC002411]